MATILEEMTGETKYSSKGGKESLCWTCTEAYAHKCIFFNRLDGYTWEQKLAIPDRVSVGYYKHRQGPSVYRVMDPNNLTIDKTERKRARSSKGSKYTYRYSHDSAAFGAFAKENCISISPISPWSKSPARKLTMF